MTLDIRGGLKNSKISSNPYVVFEELLSNAIDSYLTRKDLEPNCPSLLIAFEITLKVSLISTNDDLEIVCMDNGAGFGNSQVKAFVTKDSTYKDSLRITGIGKCKGLGRVQFFHFFNHLKIESCYLDEEGDIKNRTLRISENTSEISENDFKVEEKTQQTLQTAITLWQLKKNLTVYHNINIEEYFSAQKIRDYLFFAFIQRFIILKGEIGDFLISIKESNNGVVSIHEINSDDLPVPTEVKELKLITECQLAEPSHGTIKITRYSLPSDSFKNAQHEVALCANSAIVSSLIKAFIKNSQDRTKPLDDKFEIILVESSFLETKVNNQRDGFDIPLEHNMNEELINNVSMQDIIESIEDYVYSVLTPKDFDKHALINSTQEKFGISSSMLNNMNIKVHFSDTEENIAKRVLRKYQDEIVKETSEIVDTKQEILRLDPRSQDFRDKVTELSWKLTSSIQKVDMANLSQLVVRRATIIEILKLAIASMLDCQGDTNGRKENEKIIHNIFFPTGKDNSETTDHDIWVLNEEYHYFEHISSDKSLATIPWKDQSKLFESDIDDSLEKLFAKNNKDHRLKRPDIAIFNQEGAAIIIEFKAPGVELQEHTNDLIQYARLLAAKSNGKISRFYGYLIGDKIDESRIPANYTMFPSGLGYFSTDPIKDPSTRTEYGELYSEILMYDQFIHRAENRLKIYKEKLSISI